MQFGDELENIVLQFPNEAVGKRETRVWKLLKKTVQEFTLIMLMLLYFKEA